MSLKINFSTIKKIVYLWQDDEISNQAAALAFYTIFSLIPLLLISINICSLLFENAWVQQQVSQQIENLLNQESAAQVVNMLGYTNQYLKNTYTSYISVIFLIFGSSGFFNQIQAGINKIWETPCSDESFFNILKNRFLSFTMVLGVSFLLLVSLIMSTVVGMLMEYFTQTNLLTQCIWIGINFSFSLSIITFLFALMFKVLPTCEVSWKKVIPGAFLTAFLFIIGKYALSMYLINSNINTLYGSAGTFVIILTWCYYSARIFYFGAKITSLQPSGIVD